MRSTEIVNQPAILCSTGDCIKRPYGLVALWPCGFMALWPYDHAYVVYIYDKCRPLNLCQNMQKKVKMDCIHKMPIRVCLCQQ